MSSNYVSIFDIFGDNETMSYSQIMKAGQELELTDINIRLLIQHALDNHFISVTAVNDYEINRLPY